MLIQLSNTNSPRRAKRRCDKSQFQCLQCNRGGLLVASPASASVLPPPPLNPSPGGPGCLVLVLVPPLITPPHTDTCSTLVPYHPVPHHTAPRHATPHHTTPPVSRLHTMYPPSRTSTDSVHWHWRMLSCFYSTADLEKRTASFTTNHQPPISKAAERDAACTTTQL